MLRPGELGAIRRSFETLLTDGAKITRTMYVDGPGGGQAEQTVTVAEDVPCMVMPVGTASLQDIDAVDAVEAAKLARVYVAQDANLREGDLLHISGTPYKVMGIAARSAEYSFLKRATVRAHD